MWFNPFVAQVDVICGTETGFGGSCSVIAAVTNNQDGAFNPDGEASDRPRLLLAAQRRRHDDHRSRRS